MNEADKVTSIPFRWKTSQSAKEQYVLVRVPGHHQDVIKTRLRPQKHQDLSTQYNILEIEFEEEGRPEMADSTTHEGDAHRISERDDRERRDDGLDAGALTGNQTTFRTNDNAAIAASAALVEAITETTKSAALHAHLERQAAIRAFEGGAVTSTSAQGLTSHTSGDSTGHEGHQSPLKQSGADTGGVDGA